MTIPTKTQNQFVGDMIASWGSALQIAPVLPQGDFLLALFESVSTQLTFLQAQAVLILALTRAATSLGPDLDTWMADFNFTRLPATFASGPVVLGSLQPVAAPVFIPAATLVGGVYQGGTLVQTAGGGVVFTVIPDTTQSAYSAVSNAYIIPAGATSITASVQAVVAGTSGNVAIGSITQLGSQQGGVSLVNNLVPFSNGFNAESDAAFRARFILYLGTLAKATYAAILAAAQGVQQGIQVSPVENTTPQGTTQLGSFTVFVDNGTGAPPASLIAAVFAAVDATRAFGIQDYVVAAQTTQVFVVLNIRAAPNYVLGTLQNLVKNAVVAAVNTLAAGAVLTTTLLFQTAMSITGVSEVQTAAITINGSNTDFVPSPIQEARATSATVTVGTY